jgi:hypothetical protein
LRKKKREREREGEAHTLKPLLRVQIDLLRLRDLLQQLLDHHAVVVPRLTKKRRVRVRVRTRGGKAHDTHLGVISMWKLLCTMFTSILRFDGERNTRWSILSCARRGVVSHARHNTIRAERKEGRAAHLLHPRAKELP